MSKFRKYDHIPIGGQFPPFETEADRLRAELDRVYLKATQIEHENDSLASELSAVKQENERLTLEIQDGDYWQERAIQFYAAGNCPMCFCTDEGAHSAGCYIGICEKENERLTAEAEQQKQARIKYQGIVYDICLIIDAHSGKTTPGNGCTIEEVVDEINRLTAELAAMTERAERAEAVSRMMAAQMIEFQDAGFIVLETGEGEDEHTINTVEELIEDCKKKGEINA